MSQSGLRGAEVVVGLTLGRVADVGGGIGGRYEVPEVGVCFFDPVAGVLFGAWPAVAEVGEPGH